MVIFRQESSPEYGCSGNLNELDGKKLQVGVDEWQIAHRNNAIMTTPLVATSGTDGLIQI